MNTITSKLATAVLALAVGFTLGSLTGHADASDSYEHPCTEDEVVDITGDCVHVDEIAKWANG